MTPDAKHRGASRDYAYLGVVLLLTAAGFLMLASATGPLGFQKFGDSYWFVRHQALNGLLPGLLGFLVFWRLDYRLFRRHYLFFYGLSVALLLVVFVPGFGNTYGTARSWVNFGGFSFQTSEIVKLTMLIALAGWLEARGKVAVKDLRNGFLPFIGLLALLLGLVAMQPDVGGMSILAFEAVVVYFVAGGELAYIAALTGLAWATFYLLIKIKPYRADRFMVFLHPELDPKGAGYHINQALMTIGSGGLFGLGLGHSRQKFQYLPEVAGDSIFAVLAEELGLFGCALLLAALSFFVYRSLKIAARAPDDFGKLVTIGVAAWVAGQAFVNIASMIGLMPITGLTLPFVSFGGSSVFAILCATGLVFQISEGRKN